MCQCFDSDLYREGRVVGPEKGGTTADTCSALVTRQRQTHVMFCVAVGAAVKRL